jgi:FlaA1/EpsC-like NDP-sugar epimerase
MESIITGKRVLVTGGSGSIGSEIVRNLLTLQPKEIRVFNRSEFPQIELEKELQDYKNITYFIGDVRDEIRLNEVLEGIDIVFHTAALKHVDICEYNPYEALMTNTIGTKNIIKYALKKNIEKVILISTDKAANPTNTMGATKLLAERLITEADYNKGDRRTIFCSVRFGNVLGSIGSIIPLFKKMIREQKKVTITDLNMTRFVMTIPEAAKLVLKAAEISKGGETFILKMISVKLCDLIDAILELTSKKYGINIQEIDRKIIGLRPGEKIHEDLITETEWARTVETGEIYIILSPIDKTKTIEDYENLGGKQPQTHSYNSREVRILTKEEIISLLEQEKLI